MITKALLYFPIIAAMILPGDERMNQRNIRGLWGGQGISMEVTDSGAYAGFRLRVGFHY